MVTDSVNGSSPATKPRKGTILFEERDELWWLSGSHLRRARSLLQLRCFGENVGFDPNDAWGYAKLLVVEGLQVDLRRGDKTYSLTNRLRLSHRGPVMSRVVWLDPDLLLPTDHLQRLAQQVACGRYPGHQLVARLREPLSHGDTSALGEFGRVFVYQVGAEPLYEVDWELTTVPPDIFEALTLAAFNGNHKVPCHLVLPKGRRIGAQAKQRPPLPTDRMPSDRGQMRLLL